MGVRFLEGTYDGTQEGATVLVDSGSGFAFGPLFASYEEAESFVDWLHPLDPRSLNDSLLEAKVSEFRKSEAAREGEDVAAAKGTGS